MAGKVFVITGGGGYVGRKLTEQLLRQNAQQIRLMDIRAPPQLPSSHPLADLWADRVVFHRVDVCSFADLFIAFTPPVYSLLDRADHSLLECKLASLRLFCSLRC